MWREDGGNAWQRTTFLILSRRPPEDRSNLFAIETKEFAPALAAGQRLRFRLRASPGASEPRPGARRGKRIDPLAQRLRGLSKEERGAVRHRAMQEVGAAWLVRQGARAGFGVAEEPNGEGRMRPLLQVDGDNWRTLCREGGRKPVGFSVLDFEGVLEVTDPATFLPALARGFGRAKAFGCGLMLLRPV